MATWMEDRPAPDQQQVGNKQSGFIIKWNSEHAYSSAGSFLRPLPLLFLVEQTLFRTV